MNIFHARRTALVAMPLLLGACSPAPLSVEASAGDDAAQSVADEPTDSYLPDGDVPVLWSSPDGKKLCSTAGVDEIDLANVSPQEAATLRDEPAFATSLDEVVRKVLAESTVLGRAPLHPEYFDDFARALPQDSEYDEEAARRPDVTTYTDELLSGDPETRVSLMLESEEPSQSLTTMMVDIREAAAQASAQRELLKAWDDGTANVEEGDGFVVVSDEVTTMKFEVANGLYGLAEYSYPVDCYRSQF